MIHEFKKINLDEALAVVKALVKDGETVMIKKVGAKITIETEEVKDERAHEHARVSEHPIPKQDG